MMCVLLAAMALVGLQTRANSATLEASSCVRIWGVTTWKYVYDSAGHRTSEHIADSAIDIATGQYGPFYVVAGNETNPDARYVNVTTTTDDCIRLPFAVPAGVEGGYLQFAWGADCYPPQTPFTLWRVLDDGSSAQIWAAPSSAGSSMVYQATTGSHYYFQVGSASVPEPSSLCALGTTCLSMLWFGRRRRASRA